LSLLYIGLLSLFITLIVTPLVILGAKRFNFIVMPKANRWHKKPTALLGGVAIFIGFIITVLIFNNDWSTKALIILAGTLFMFISGFIDDLKPLNPKTKFLLQLLIAAVTVSFGVHMELGLGPILNYVVSGFWIIGIINAVNLIDNMDGLSSGITFVSSLTLLCFSLIANNNFLIVISMALIGVTIGFLIFNFHPAKIFMGDCGSLFIGYLLAVASISFQGHLNLDPSLINALYIPVFLLGVPLFDTFFVMVERKRNGRSITQGGKDHTSHRLAYILQSEKKAVSILYLLGLLSGIAGLLGYLYPGIIQFILITCSLIIIFSLSFYLIRYAPAYEYNLKKEKKLNVSKTV